MIRALIVVCVFFIFQQITGINVPFYYGPKILATFFQSGHECRAAAGGGGGGHRHPGRGQRDRDLFRLPLDRQVRPAPAGHGGLRGHGGVYAGRGGRSRVLHRHTEDRGGHGRLLVLHHLVRDRCRRDGWLIQGEVFPTSVRGRAAAIGAAVDWVANFALIEAFPAWQNAWGLAGVMVSFAVLSVVAIGFVFKFLPETKGRSVEEVVQIFEKQAEAGKAPV